MSRKDDVLTKLRDAPEGMTASDVAELLNIPATAASTILSRFGCWGVLEKIKIGRNGKTTWRIK